MVRHVHYERTYRAYWNRNGTCGRPSRRLVSLSIIRIGPLRNVSQRNESYVIMDDAAAAVYALASYYIFGWRLHRMTFQEVMRELFAMAAGALMAYLPFVAYFTWHGAISEFLHYNFIFNYHITLIVAKEWGRTLWFIKYFAFWQFPFVTTKIEFIFP